MKHFSLKKVKRQCLTHVVCDKCQNKVVADQDELFAGAEIGIVAGYSSKHDGNLTFDLCDNCTTKLIRYLSKS